MRFISFLIEQDDWDDPKPRIAYDGKQVGDKNQRRKLRAIYKKRQTAMCHELAVMLDRSGELDPKVSMANLMADLVVAGPRQGVDNSIYWALDRNKYNTPAEFYRKFPKIRKIQDELVQVKFAYEAYGGKLASESLRW